MGIDLYALAPRRCAGWTRPGSPRVPPPGARRTGTSSTSGSRTHTRRPSRRLRPALWLPKL